MKKIIYALFVFMTLTISASAESLLFPVDKPLSNTNVAIVFFNNDNTVSSVVTKTAEVHKDGYLVRDIDITDTEVQYKLFFPDGNTILNGKLFEEKTDDNISEYNKDLYTDDGALLFAPAMVTKVKQVYEDDEVKHELTLLYQGKEQSFIFDSTLKIVSASDNFSFAINNDVSFLRPGDAIILNHAFKNEPRSITFVHRPSATEPVFDSSLVDFKPLYTSSSSTRNDVALYSFGIVTDVGANYLILHENDGTENNSKIISFHPDSSVYVFDAVEKTVPYTYFASGIFPSYIDSADIDQNGNITNWRPSDSRTYALVRLYDDIATDILVYEY